MTPPNYRICPDCGGDGIETCSNPDHGFIDAVGGEIYRLGCPVCGHDPNYKTGCPCPTCAGSPKPGYLPIFYTPEQWVEAGGKLKPDTMIYVKNVVSNLWGLHEWQYFDKCVHKFDCVIATEAGKPPENWREEDADENI